jgi:predicted ATP-dependent endonuclease of OLD family
VEYREFSFKNFKGIAEMSLPLDGRVTTLIGLNESGKTTILEAIFCFTYGAENLDAIDPNMASLREPERWIPISRRANFNDTIQIQATVALNEADRAAYEEHMRKNHSLRDITVPDLITITETYFFENSRYKRTQRTWGLPLEGIQGRRRTRQSFGSRTPEWAGAVAYLREQLPSIWYFPNFLFELPDRFELEDVAADNAGEDRDKNSFYRSTFEQILAQLGTGATLETHIVQRVKSDDRADLRNLRALLLEMGRAMTKTVFEGWNRIFGRAPGRQEVELDVDEDDDGVAFLELKIKGPDGYYDLSERSLGFRWFFMFLLMTSYRGLQDGDRETVFLLDEPASNLHSSAQAQLLKSFEALAHSCRLIYTTHSHHLINIKWLDNAYVVKNAALADFAFDDYVLSNTASHTDITATRYRQFVAAHPDQTSYFQPVLDLLEYRPSALEPIPNVVLVEGKSDFYLLKYAVSVLGLTPDLPLVPGTGAGALDTLIRLHIGWGKSFVILLDGDAEGRKQKQRYETEFGPILNGRCVLLPDVVNDPAVDEIEKLLTAADEAALLHATSASPPRASKKAVQNALMEVFATRQHVSLSSDFTSRVSRVLTELEQQLQTQQ